MSGLLVKDAQISRAMIRERRRLGHDRYDEVWDGVYIMSPIASNFHQDLVGDMCGILIEVVRIRKLGRVQPGANVSDRTDNWKKNYRVPDVVVVLNGGRAIDRGTHWQVGPDFLTEVSSPGDSAEEKLPFYSRIKVREVLIIQRDTRAMQLYGHDGNELVPVDPTVIGGKSWFRSEVVPLAFRLTAVKAQGPRTLVRRTDSIAGEWTV